MIIDMKSSQAGPLRRGMFLNVAFSSLCAAVIIFGHDSLIGWLGLTDINLYALGVGLLIFVTLLIWMTGNSALDESRVTGVIAGDWMWVIGSLLLALWWRDAFTTEGLWVVVGVALGVAICAWLQQAGLTRLRKQLAG